MEKVRNDMAEEILRTSGKIWSIWLVTHMLFENSWSEVIKHRNVYRIYN